MVKVKLCGMTNLEDCERAIDLGADYVGFVFYKESQRYISPERVGPISARIDGRVCKVGVFVKENDERIMEIMDFCGLDLCQVYRRSTIERSITAYRIEDRLTDETLPRGLILLDSYSAGFGGSGRSFDFGLLEGASFLDRAFIAGGIGPRNILDALRLKPYGVDLVSSMEAYPGKKDHRKMEAFMTKVRRF
jgi:phosphoribosylanthranilate isomerase